jgi:hypothetical protein
MLYQVNYIKSINIKNTYSFGPDGTEALSDLSKINLIIGKNGAGKSNILRTLKDLPIDDVNLGEIVDNTWIPSKDPSKIFKGIIGEENHWQYDHQFLDIKLDIGNIITEPLNQITGFVSNQSGKSSILLGNSYDLFTSLRKLICYYKSGDRKTLANDIDAYRREWIQFAIYYILDQEITINSESFDEYKIKSKDNKDNNLRGGHSINIENCPDSYFAIINLIRTILVNDKSILFIEEPESHIEPRALKKLINFILYFFVNEDCVHTSVRQELEQSKSIYNKLTIHSLNYKGFGNTIVQRLTYLMRDDNRTDIDFPNNRYNQIFIISHSPILIDYISNLNSNKNQVSSIYEVYTDEIVNNKSKCEIQINFNNNLLSTVSKIRKIQDSVNQQELIESLGIKSSDLILSNGIIWVEGPSDSIYIKKFINMYIRDNGLEELEYGRHYLFAMYGGTLLNNYLIYDSSKDDNDLKKITSFIRFNKNFYIVIDSDAISNIENLIEDKSKFSKAKDYIRKDFEQNTKSNTKNGLWYDKDDIQYTTIENYIELEELKKLLNQGSSKVNNSVKVVNYLNKYTNIKLVDIGKKLNEHIKDIYEKIISWNK